MCIVNKFYGGILSARSAIGIGLIKVSATTKLYSRRVPETRKKMDSEIPELSDEAEEHVKLENGDEVIITRAQANCDRRKTENRRCHYFVCSAAGKLFGWPAAKSLLFCDYCGRGNIVWLVF